MIHKEEIDDLLEEYDTGELTIGTLCSHSALQIFHGAKQEGLRTLGICIRDRKPLYESYPLACPDEFLIVETFKDALSPECQEKLRRDNVIIIPHGSFVEYIGPHSLEEEFYVPMFGNRRTLEWERDRRKQRLWLERAGLRVPREYRGPSEIEGKAFVKLPGAKGGRGFFTVSSEKEFYEELKKRTLSGVIDERESEALTIQEFLPGVRYYPHYFYSLFERGGARVGEGRVELLSMDKRIEPIDESYRGLPEIPEAFFDYTVTGNQPVVIRESLLPDLLGMGVSVVGASINLFPPGMIGAFCLETIYHPLRGFTVFEVSARIVAGTNLYPQGSPYSYYLYKEPMSTGRRIAREIRVAAEAGELGKIIF